MTLTPKQQEALDAYKEHGGVKSAARALGITRQAMRDRLTGAEAKLDPAIKDSMAAVGTNLIPALAWAKTKSEDGTSYSVLLKPEAADPINMAEAMRAAFDGMEAAPPIVAPAQVMADLCTVYPLMDAHIGLHAWGRETGGDDYDLRHAAQDMRHAFAKVTAITPASTKAILIVGGDYFHSDDTRAETPASKHKLDMDGRFFKVIDVGIAILAETVQRLLEKHQDVLVKVLRGNHDPHAHLTLTFALSERYRQDPRVTVEKDPRDLFMAQWGKCAIFAHHGDKGKPQQMALYLSDICPFWSEARHRHYLTGHIHHDHAKDFGPLRWESLRAFCPPDAYAASMGFGGRRALQSLTFHSVDGLVLRALDPIDRAA